MATVFQAGSRVRIDVANGADGKSAAQEEFDAGLIDAPTPEAREAKTREIATEEAADALADANLGPAATLAARTGLAGFSQVEQGPPNARAKLSYSQVGDFAAPRVLKDGSVAVQGPDAVYPEGRLVKRALPNTGPATLWLILAVGQSNGVGATNDNANASDPNVPITTTAPLPGTLLCFNGGPNPLQANPSAVSKTLAVQPANYATLVDARELNPFVARETWLTAAGEVIAAAVKPGDKVLIVNTGLGSCSFTELVQGFPGSRATFSASITGTTMTVTNVTITAGDGLTNGLVISGPGVIPGTVITGVPLDPNGVPTGVEGPYTVSPAQTVASFTGATTADPAPMPWSNLETLTAAAVQKAAALGLTPRIAAFLFNQGEAEQSVAVVASRTTQLNTLRAKVDSLKAITGQTQDILIVHPQVGAPIYDINHTPATNIRNNSPDVSLMNTVSPATIAAELAARTIPNFATFAQYDQDSPSTPGVHYRGMGHSQMGEKAGNLVLDWLEGKSTTHPYVVSLTGLLKTSVRRLLLSEDAVIDETLVSDPGQKGVRYYDDAGEVPITSVSISGPVVTLAMARMPSGVSERAEVACSNGLALGSYTGTVWPFIAPPTYLGPKHGQRAPIRAAATRWRSQRTGRPLDRYLAHQKVAATPTSGAATTMGVFSDLGVTPTLVLSASDPLSYPGSGQAWTDRAQGATYQFGTTSGAEASDPTFSAGPPPAFLFDGGDSFVRTAGAAAFADLHKAGSAYVIAVLYRVGSLAANQHLVSTCRNTSGGGAGIAVRVSTAGRFGLSVRGDANSVVMAYNSPEVVPINTWRVGMIGVDVSAGTLWHISSGAPTAAYSATAYTSPSAAAAESAATIGKNGAAVSDASAVKLAAGGGIAELAVGPYQTAEKMMPLFLALQARAGL